MNSDRDPIIWKVVIDLDWMQLRALMTPSAPVDPSVPQEKITSTTLP